MFSQDEKVTQDFYNANAGKWTAKYSQGTFWEPQHLKFKKYLASGKIIDLGCGGGNDTAWFLENGYQYLGVDASQSMLKQARRRNPAAKYQQKDFYSLNFPPGEFDGFWAACSLLHVPKEKIHGVLTNIKNIIKPASLGFISLKEGVGQSLETSITMEGSRFFANYGTNEFAAILEASGFKLLETGTKPNSQQPKVDFIYYFVRS